MCLMWETGSRSASLPPTSGPVEGVGRLAHSLSCDGVVAGVLGTLCTDRAGSNPRLRAFGCTDSSAGTAAGFAPGMEEALRGQPVSNTK